MLQLRILLDAVLTIGVMMVAVSILYSMSMLIEIGVVPRETAIAGLPPLCAGMQMALLVAPFPMALNAVQGLNGGILPMPAIKCTAICNILGVSYALKVGNSAILSTNMFGLLCQTLYLTADQYIATENEKLSDIHWVRFAVDKSVVFNLGLLVCTRWLPTYYLGQLIIYFNIFLFAIPLANLPVVLTTRDASSMSFPLVAIGCVTNAAWTVFGMVIADNVLLVPSLLAYMLGAFQLMLITWSKGSLPFDLSFLLLLGRLVPKRADKASDRAGEEPQPEIELEQSQKL